MNEARLYEILRLKRGHGSIGVDILIEQQLLKYNPTLFVDPDGERLAYVVQVGPTPDKGGSKSLMCCHLDTVHGRSVGKVTKLSAQQGDEDFVNDIDLDTQTGFVWAKGDVLGADDGAGVWLLLEMIDAGVPGSYAFHFAEEVGGIGSRGMAKYFPDFLSQFDRAIAFDRKGTHSVITHQSTGRCCSNDFADALSLALSDDNYFYQPDDGGVFTDTANYTDLIGEACNCSVGYYNEHTSSERLDLEYLFSLRDRCIALDWENLPTVRKPGEVDPDDYNHLYGWGGYGTGGTRKGMTQAEYDDEFEYYVGKADGAATIDDLYKMDFYALMDMCEDDPYQAASLIMQLLYGYEDGGSGAEDVDPVGGSDDLSYDDAWDDQRLKVGMH